MYIAVVYAVDCSLVWSGQIYSVNDARYFDWPEGLRQYIDTVRQGKGRYPKKYSARYICSLVADLHRTLLYGGVAMNPRDHLRLVYEANPLSFIVEQAGGRQCCMTYLLKNMSLVSFVGCCEIIFVRE